MSQHAVPRYTQSPMSYQPTPQHERHPVLESLNFDYAFNPVYGGGPPRYDDGTVGGGFETSSASSSPGPITPLDVKPPPAYIEPFKINPTDYSSMFGQIGLEEQSAPPMYSYAPEQQGLLYHLGL